MLKANVGLSRKVSRDYQSTGYAVNIEGEIAASPDDPEAVLERVKELFDLVHEALQVEVDRDQGEQAIGRRDEERSDVPSPEDQGPGHAPDHPPPGRNESSPPTKPRPTRDDSATNKQVQYLLSLGKRQRLSTPQLEGRIEEVLGRQVGLYQLTKREAGTVIDALTRSDPDNAKAGSRP